MNRPNAITIVIALALLLAAAASFFVYQFLNKQGSKQRQGITVIVAAQDIPVGAKLDGATIKTAAWPKENLPQQGYFSDAKTLSGRLAVRQISAGDIITEPKLMPLNRAEMGGVMTYIVPKGHRAVTVAVNEVAGVAGFITPGSRVDVVLSHQLPENGNEKEHVSKVILQNIPVLATGQVTEQKEGKPTVVPTVTLDLVPADAEKLLVGVKNGSLHLLLRNVIDTENVITGDGVTVGSVMGRKNSPPAPKELSTTAPSKAKSKKTNQEQPGVTIWNF